MGWNTGWTIMEQTVIGVYDTGGLNRPVLEVLLKPYANTDIDMGGHRDLKTRDGKNVMEVILEIMEPAIYTELKSRVYTNQDDDNFCYQVYEEFSVLRNTLEWI